MKTPEQWLMLSIPVTEASAELISGFIFSLGAEGVVEHADRLEAFFRAGMTDAKEQAICVFTLLATTRLRGKSGMGENQPGGKSGLECGMEKRVSQPDGWQEHAHSSQLGIGAG